MSTQTLTHGVLGRSAQGRPIAFVRLSLGAPASPRILILGGQHGDEKASSDAVLAVAAQVSWLEHLAFGEIVLIPCANPDGRALGVRETAEGIDLNRDHQRLKSREAREIHRFAREYQPHFIVDVHTFKGRRRALLRHRVEHAADVLIDLSNHPDVLADGLRLEESLLTPALRDLGSRGYRAGPYVLFDEGGRARNSSVDVVDARNGLTSTVGAVGILVEGREPSRGLGHWERTRLVLQDALQSVVRACTLLGNRPDLDLDHIYLDARRRCSGFETSAWSLGPHDGVPKWRALPFHARLDLKPRRSIELPLGYFVPKASPKSLEVVIHHGFTPETPDPNGTVEVAKVRSSAPSEVSGRPWRRMQLSWHEGGKNSLAESHVFFSTLGPRGKFLARLLEPASRYSLHRYLDLDLELCVGENHPILRMVSKKLGSNRSAANPLRR